MPSGEMLIKLFENFKNQDEEGFTKIAFEIIEEEKQKNHYLLANKLKKTLFNQNSKQISSNSCSYISNFKDLPKDKDKGTNLLEIKYTEKSFDDIFLSDDIKVKLDQILVEYNKKDILNSYNLNPKTKVLFCGPPGCGKTLCAEVLSYSLGLPILYTRFDSLISSYLGETASNLSSVFNFASRGNWVLFFDEFDAIGKSRDNTDEHGELKRVVNTFLQLLDNFGNDSFVIAATNHEKLIDSALWRRFDEVIFFDKPGSSQIEMYINMKLRSFHHKSLSINKFTNKLEGFSYADIERICVESIKHCVLNNLDSINNDIFESQINAEIKRSELIKNISG